MAASALVPTEESKQHWLASASISVTAAVQVIADRDTKAEESVETAPLRLRLRGQVCRKRHLSKNLIFLTLRQAESCAVWDADAPRVQTIAKLQSLGPEQMSELKRLVKLGDMMQVEGTVHAGAMGPELQLERCAVVERWAVSSHGAGFKPDIEPPSDTLAGATAQQTAASPFAEVSSSSDGAALACGEDSAPLCKFWVNTGVCKRVGCRFSHAKEGDTRSWREIRTEWQRERSAKRHANRKALRMTGDDDAGDGNDDVHGDRKELSFELAAQRNVPTTLLDPRHPGKFVEERAASVGETLTSGNAGPAMLNVLGGDKAGGESLILPQRVRAMLTLHGATRVDTDATRDRDGTETGAAAALMSTPATAHDDNRKAKKRRPDAVKSAGVGWSEVPSDVPLEDILSHCSALIGMHPDQATEPIVATAIRYRRHWAVIPCCVFAADFPDRSLPTSLQHPPPPDPPTASLDHGIQLDHGRRPVASYEDLVEYLVQLGNAAAKCEEEKVQRAFLPFIGKNQVLWQRFAD